MPLTHQCEVAGRTAELGPYRFYKEKVNDYVHQHWVMYKPVPKNLLPLKTSCLPSTYIRCGRWLIQRSCGRVPTSSKKRAAQKRSTEINRTTSQTAELGLKNWHRISFSGSSSVCYILPSGKRLHNDGKSPCSMGKSTINHHFQQLC